jgi:hypothetical protein
MQSEKTAKSEDNPKPLHAKLTTETGTELNLTAQQKLLVEGWEKAHGRKMTEQEIKFGIELWNATVGEL